MVDPRDDVLLRAGVPVGPARPPPRGLPDDESLRCAVLEIEARWTPEELVPYAAWLSAWAHHWPTRFRAVFGDEGRKLERRLRAGVVDANRYIKLRRIAIQNLAELV